MATPSPGEKYYLFQLVPAMREIEISIDPVYPQATTGEVSILRYTSAMLTGEASDNGGTEITETGFYFGTSSNPASSGTRMPVAVGSGKFSATLTDLVLGGTYYCQAFAVNADGESLGEEKSFNPSEVEPGTFIDQRDQQVYGSVKIGQQVWMSENLKATLLNDGTEIPYLEGSVAWSNNNGSAYCWYDDDPQWKDRGALYRWYTVETGKLCPSGWHVPSDTEWRQFEYYLGMDESVALTDGYRGTNEGGMLKTTTLWNSPNTGASNEFQFSALPSGRRGFEGEFAHINAAAFFWSSERGEWQRPLARILYFESGQISRTVSMQNNGLSVRCVKDE